MNVRNGAPVRIGALELNFLLDETQGSRDLVMFELTVPSNARVPLPHHHKDVDEIVYGLEGVFTMTVDGETHEIAPGDSLFVGRGRVHHFSNPSPTTARVLAVLNPGSIGKRYFEEIAHEVNVPGKPDLTKVAEIMQRHGLVPA
jgi:quercetin dioxygenase-like cupin family protein